MFAKSALVVATAAAIALTSLDLRPAQAAPLGGIGKQSSADEFSGARKKRRGVHPGVPLAAFGAIVGTIAGIAQAERRREYYERPYHGGPYAYEAPYRYGYAPQGYAPHVYAQPGYGYGRHGYGGHVGGYRQQGDGAPAPGQSPTAPPGAM